MIEKAIRYSEQVATELCDRLASGETLKSILTEPHMPTKSTVWHWTRDIALFATNLTQARLAHADSLADEVVLIADTEEDAQKARNRIDARKWATKVINPARYGERLDLNINEKPDLAGIRAAALSKLPDHARDSIEVIDMAAITSGDIDPDDMLS